MEEVVNEIRDTKTKLAIAEREGDASSRDFLRTYLVELQKKENLLLQQQIQQAPPATQPGNYLHPVNFIELFPSHVLYICYLLVLMNLFDGLILCYISSCRSRSSRQILTFASTTPCHSKSIGWSK